MPVNKNLAGHDQALCLVATGDQTLGDEEKIEAAAPLLAAEEARLRDATWKVLGSVEQWHKYVDQYSGGDERSRAFTKKCQGSAGGCDFCCRRRYLDDETFGRPGACRERLPAAGGRRSWDVIRCARRYALGTRAMVAR